MGTNFYIKIPIKARSNVLQFAEKLIDLLKSNKANKYNVADLCYEIQESFKDQYIHLGKRSAGWAFCWDLNEMKFYEPTLESIRKFIDDNNAIIVDEYGEKFNWDQFINDELKTFLHPGKTEVVINDGEKVLVDRYTHQTYALAHPNERGWFTNDPKAHEWNLEQWAKDGNVDYAYDELITNENLRFALYTDFS